MSEPPAPVAGHHKVAWFARSFQGLIRQVRQVVLAVWDWTTGRNVVSDASKADMRDSFWSCIYVFVGSAAAAYVPIVVFLYFKTPSPLDEIISSGDIAIIAVAITIPSLQYLHRNRRVPGHRRERLELFGIALILAAVILNVVLYMARTDLLQDSVRSRLDMALLKISLIVLIVFVARFAYIAKLVELSRDLNVERADLDELVRDREDRLERKVGQ